MLKRAFDFVFGLFALIFTLPIIILSALMVYLEDGFPVIFSQKCVGKDGQLFEMFKIRTLVKNAEQLRVQVEKREADGHLIYKRMTYITFKTIPYGWISRSSFGRFGLS